jgi:DNA mismatch repair protein MutL
LAQNSITPSLDFEQDSIIFDENKSTNTVEKDENDGDLIYESRLSGNFSGFQHFKTENGEKGSNGSTFNWKKEKTDQERNNLKNWENLYQGLVSQDNIEDSDDENQSFESSLSFSEQVSEGESKAETFGFQLYQLHKSFIVSSIKSGLMLVDQSAAHQRILYEDYLQSLEKNIPLVQNSLFPVNINLSPAQSSLMQEILGDLNNLGIDIREFGKNSFVIHGLPAEMKSVNEQKMIEELLEQFRNGLSLKLSLRENLAKSLAMQTAVKQGTALSQTEMQGIIDRLFSCDQPYSSPSGKKTFIRIEMTELLKRFE